MKILLSPHNDDECLFASYIILREKPRVFIITDGVQHSRRYGIPIVQRIKESLDALEILGIDKKDVEFLHMSDVMVNPDTLETLLDLHTSYLSLDIDTVYAPEVLKNGNIQHNIVGQVAKKLWGDKVIGYHTYELHDLEPKGLFPIKPTPEEEKLKAEALKKYTSQLRVNRIHFDCVKGKNEYVNKMPSFAVI